MSNLWLFVLSIIKPKWKYDLKVLLKKQIIYYHFHDWTMSLHLCEFCNIALSLWIIIRYLFWRFAICSSFAVKRTYISAPFCVCCRYNLDSIENESFEENSADEGTTSATNSPAHGFSHSNRPNATRSVTYPIKMNDITYLNSALSLQCIIRILEYDFNNINKNVFILLLLLKV